MPFTDIFKRNYRGRRNRTAEDLPTPLETYVQQTGEVEKTPIWWFSWKWLRDTTYTSDLLSLIIRTITAETFKNGINIDESYASKCSICGRTYEEQKAICDYDDGICITPDYEDWKRLDRFINKTNRFDEDLATTMREIDADVNIGDNGWIYLLKEYYYDDKNNVTGADVVEAIRMAPEKMRMIMSKYGFGTTEQGAYTYFCPVHRTHVYQYEDKNKYYCPDCKREMLEAWYLAKDREFDIYYAREEIYHVKRWSNAQGYGVPPLWAIYMKVNTLLRMDKFILQAYSLQRSPQALLLLRGRPDDIRRGWEWLMQKARENPNMLYPLAMPGGDDGTRRIMEYQTFDLKPVEWSWTEMRKEFREVVGAFFGVQPMFTEGVQTGGGLNNEGLQITATNRTIQQQQAVWNGFLDWLGQSLGCDSYQMKLIPNELEDEMRDIQLETSRFQLAGLIKEFGYDIEIHKDSKGRLDFKFEKLQQQEPEQEEDEGENPNSEESPDSEDMHNVAEESKQGKFSQGSQKFLADKAKEGKAVFIDGLADDDWLQQSRKEGVSKTNYKNRNARRRKMDAMGSNLDIEEDSGGNIPAGGGHPDA